MSEKYAKISKESKAALAKRLRENILACTTRTMIKENYYMYEVVLQGTRFRTDITDKALDDMIDCSIEALEELKKAVNDGYDREKYTRTEKELNAKWADDPEMGECMIPIEMYNSFETESMHELGIRIASVCRVGGAYWAFISRPVLLSIFVSVLGAIVDQFDDPACYLASADFFLRGLMYLRSTKVKEE